MRRMGAVRMAAAVFLLCFGWGGVLSCSNGSDGNNNEDPNEIHNDAWKINENKSGFIGTNGKISTHGTYTGYDGKFIDYLGADGYVDYAVHSDEAQDVTILLRYAYWGSTDALRGAQVVVNGETDEEVIYCNWTSKTVGTIWQDSNAITVRLNAGDNALRVVPVSKGTAMLDAKYPDGVEEAKKTWTADGNLPNIDYLQITGNGLRAATDATALPAYYRVKVSGDFGTVGIEPKQDFYAKGAEITVTATPNDGYRFDAWSGSCASNDEKWKLTVTEELNLAAHFIPSNYKPSDAMVGYATITDDSGTKYTITGGAGGETIEIASLSDLKANADKLSSDVPYIVHFTGEDRITTADNKSEYYTIGSNKTMYGKANGAGLKNIEMRVTGSNVIIRNMVFGEVIGDDTFGGKGNDALSLNGAKHVWIDHCELFSQLEPKNNDGTDAGVTEEKAKKDWYDGLLDVKNGAAWITVSNCYFHDHWKAVLCGSSDKDENGDRAIRITFVGNYWENINSRQPLFRWGKAHIYNNYFKGAADKQANCIDVRMDSQVWAEGNYFDTVKNAIGLDLANGGKDSTGKAAYRFTNTNKCVNAPTPNSGTLPDSEKPRYDYMPKTADEAKTNVVNEAGAKLTADEL